jgi:hypothetical protein
MTISSTYTPAQFSGNSVTVAFAFTFKTFDEADLVVVLTSSSGVETTKTITTHYTVSLNADQNNNPGGTVTMITAPATGETLTIARELDALQETDITNGGGFYPEVIEDALDRLTMLSQQNSDILARSLRSSVAGGSIGDLPTATDRASKYLAFDASGDPIATSGTAGSPTSAFMETVLDDATASDARATLGVAIGTNVQAYDADIPTVAASQGEMEAGTEAALRSMSPLRVAQAIAALVPPAASGAPTGTVFDYVGSTEPSGYVFLSGLTIGNGSSGGTGRANADTSALFVLLWDSMADAQAAVSGGRGANAAADFAANKTITLPDARGRIVAGKDNMGGSTASRITNAGAGIVGTTLGVAGGSQTHTLTEAQLASHTHSVGSGAAIGGDIATGGGTAVYSGAQTSGAAGSGNAHNNTQPTLILNKIIKL